jgi:glycosyltransferase involved in cell wall biosynthesis
MRVSIDAVPLLVRSAGVKNYLFHWIVHLRRLLGDANLTLFPFLDLDLLAHLDHEGSAASRPGTITRQGLLYGLNLHPNHVWDWIGPSSDIFHATKLLNPPRRARLTATMYDMTCWLVPEFHQPANVAAEKRFAARIWKRADGLIAISENTRRDAIRTLDLKPEVVQVIYPGVAQAFFQVMPEDVEAARRKYGLERPYVLHVGTIEPRKNIDRLLDTWQSLPPSFREEFELVAIGPEGWQSAATMDRLRSAPGVRYLGYVPERDLPPLTAAATVFVYPSLYEGFGFPVAQAMAAGVPVITSNLSSLPEITGDAAVLVEPRSEAQIRGAVEGLLTSPSRRAELASAGRSRAVRFQWDVCAQETLQFFKKVLGAN